MCRRGELSRMEVAVQRGEVTARECHVETLHPRAVFELLLRDRRANRDGDALVQRGEVTEAARIRHRPLHDPLDRIHYLVDVRDVRDRRQWRRGHAIANATVIAWIAVTSLRAVASKRRC